MGEEQENAILELGKGCDGEGPATLVSIGGELDKKVIAIIQIALERALSGDTVGVAIVEVSRTRSVTASYSSSSSYHYLNSGVARLAHRLAGEED